MQQKPVSNMHFLDYVSLTKSYGRYLFFFNFEESTQLEGAGGSSDEYFVYGQLKGVGLFIEIIVSPILDPEIHNV